MQQGARFTVGVVLALSLAGFLQAGLQYPSGEDAPLSTSFAPPGIAPAAVTTTTFPAAADAYIESGGNANRNFGAAQWLGVGYDAANATAYRSLLQFDLSAIPQQAVVYDATFRARVDQGAAGQAVTVHRVRGPWTEGTGSQFGYRTDVTAQETAGVDRVREPVDLNFTVPVSLNTFVPADFRVYDDQGIEVPSQVYGATYAGPLVTSVHIVFGATVNASSSRTYSIYFGNSLPVVPGFRAKTPYQRLWSFPAGSKYAPLAAADLNDDGRLEVVFAAFGTPANTSIYAVQWDGSQLWSQPAADVVEASTTIADVDGDGELEVVYATDGNVDFRVHALSGRNGTEKWASSVPTRPTYSPIAMADIDGDGPMELFIGSQDRYLYAINGENGTERWKYLLGGSAVGQGAAIGNLSGDATPEIVYTSSTGDFYALRANGSLLWSSSPTGRSVIVTPSLGDFTPGWADLDVVSGDQAVNGNEFAFRGTDGSSIWVHGSGSDQWGGQVLVDFEDDGQLETVFAMTRRNSLRAVAWNGAVVSTRWTFATGAPIYSVPAAADVNLDGIEEILFGSNDGNLYVLDASGNLLQQFPGPDIVSATPLVADLDGDGTMEIVFSSRSYTYAYSTNSLGHDWRTGAYNHRQSGRFLDGNSPHGEAFLQASVGTVISLAGNGVTWRTYDGTTPWATNGSDYDAASEASVTIPGDNAWVAWNVTGLVRSWVSGVQPNVGLLLRTDEMTNAVSVLVSREAGIANQAVLEVTYTPNIPPTISARVPDQRANEDGPLWDLALAGFAQDPDTPLTRLRWDLAGVAAGLYDFTGGNVTGNHILRFQPRLNAYGNDLVTLYLFDEDGNFDAQTLWINITPVNDGPVFRTPPTLYVRRGQPYTFNFAPYIEDVDHPDGQLFLRSNKPSTTTVTGLNVTFSYPATYVDPWDFIVLTVDDGVLAASQSITIGVTDDTPPHLIVPLPDLQLYEGTQRTDVFDLDDYFLDPDQDVLYFVEGFTYVTITIKANHSVDISALSEWNGIESGTFRAVDPTGAIAEDSILIEVLPVNDAPAIAFLPPFVIRFNETYVFDLAPHVWDADDDPSQLVVWTSRPANITVVGMTLRMMFWDTYGTPPLQLTAPYTLPLTMFVRDPAGAQDFLGTSLTVGFDYPPRLRNGVPIPDQVLSEDTPYPNAFNLDTYFVDIDSSTIFYTSGQVNIVVTIQANDSVDFRPGLTDWFGAELVTFRAMDDQGAYAEDTIKITVRPVNDAPRIAPIPLIESKALSFVFNLGPYLSDIENDSLQMFENSPHVTVQGFLLIFNYADNVDEDAFNVTVSDWELSTAATVRVRIVGPDLLLSLLPWLLALAAAVGIVVASRVLRHMIEHVFLVYGGGVPMVHLSRTLTADKDPDLVASMFTAIQSFMDESFHSIGVGELKSIELADHRVALARGKWVTLIVLYRGRRSSSLDRRAETAVKEIETKYEGVLSDWNGDVDRIDGVRQLLERFYGAKDTGQVVRGLRPVDIAPRGPANGR